MAFAPVALVVLHLLLLLPSRSFSFSEDEACLSNLHRSLEDPTNSLHNWTSSTFSSSCNNGQLSFLQGVTCNNGRVYKLSLPSLSLSGSISPFISNCTNLQSLDLSSNSLTGPIPPELSLLLNLAVLNLSSNLLSGFIPPQLALCAYLNVIDLHSNLLTGPIPDQLGLLVRLSAFDVSNNRLQGPIPPLLSNRSGTSLPRFNASSFTGNRGLYGFPLPPLRNRGLSVLAIVGIGLGSGLLSLVLSFTAVCIWLRVTEKEGMVPGEDALAGVLRGKREWWGLPKEKKKKVNVLV
ncbi:putative non-specific serine/threonine protein kinase [Dioscorea sansibarensis]